MNRLHAFIPRFWRLITFLLFLGLLIRPQQMASAHAADMYAQDQSLLLSAENIQIHWDISPGPLLAYTVWNMADQNLDDIISSSEANAWANTMLPLWTIAIDDQPIQGLVINQVIWPDDLTHMQAGEQTIQISLTASWPGALTGSHHIEIHNTFEEKISLNWFSVNSEAGLTFHTPQQDNGVLAFDLFFPETNQAATGDDSEAVTYWESGAPNLSGLSSALTDMATDLANPGSTDQKASGFAQVTEALTGLVRSNNFSPEFFLSAFLLSMALGCLHALTPGHGKTLVAAYLVGSRGRVVDAVFLGSVVTITHTGSVLLLGGISLVASRYILPSVVMPILEILSGLLVIGFGAQLLIKRAGEIRKRRMIERNYKPTSRLQIKIAPAEGKLDLGEKLLDTPHLKPPAGNQSQIPYRHANDHVHVLPGHEITWKSLLTLGVSGGLVPCPDAIAILLIAIAINRILFGMALIVAFSLGLAVVLIGIGIAMVNGARIIRNTRFTNAFSEYTPIVSAAVVLTLGASLVVSPLSTLFSASSQNATLQTISTNTDNSASFNPATASLVYLAPDVDQHDQIFRRSLAGGDPVQYTQNSTGILDFVISPDQSRILYYTFKSDGSTAFHLITVDGTQDELLLDCTQAECIDPIWTPDGSKIFYERRSNSTDEFLQIYSIWWLDVQTRETQPVFQDQEFPAYTSRLSADGQWLSYISPSNNSLRIYNLVDGRNHSIDYRSGMPEVWSPVETKLLFWDIQMQGYQGLLKLKLFDVNTNQVTDLGQTDNLSDYTATWSPDGQWIAVSRGGINSTDSSYQEQIWLMKSDGSQPQVWINHLDATYGDLCWSPDGNYFLFSSLDYSTSQAEPEVWLKDTRTGQETKIMTGGRQHTLIP